MSCESVIRWHICKWKKRSDVCICMLLMFHRLADAANLPAWRFNMYSNFRTVCFVVPSKLRWEFSWPGGCPWKVLNDHHSIYLCLRSDEPFCKSQWVIGVKGGGVLVWRVRTLILVGSLLSVDGIKFEPGSWDYPWGLFFRFHGSMPREVDETQLSLVVGLGDEV